MFFQAKKAKKARKKAKFDKQQQPKGKGKGRGRGKGRGKGKGKAKSKQAQHEAEDVKTEEPEAQEVKAEDADASPGPRVKRRLTFGSGLADSDTAEGPAPDNPEMLAILGECSTPGTPELFGDQDIFGEVGEQNTQNDDGYSPSIAESEDLVDKDKKLVPESQEPCTLDVADAVPENPGGQSAAASSGDPMVPLRGGGASSGPSGPRGPNQHHTPDTLASVSPPGASILLNCVWASF